MKSLLIGTGQEFSLVRDAFIKAKNKIKIIGENIPEHLAFKNRQGKSIEVSNLIKEEKLSKADLFRIDSIFISIYDSKKLFSALKLISKLNLSQPIFIISTAISEKFKGRFSTFHFIPIQDLFSEQIQNIIAKCEFLFRVNSLKVFLKPTDKVLIVIYENPDPDAIASALALKILLSKIGAKSTMAYTGAINRLQNQVLIKELGKKYYKIDDLDLIKFNRVALVDAQPYFFKERYNFDIVIDHHPRREKFKASFIDIRSKVGATSTILTEYLLNAGIKINKKLATALLFGIKTDTNKLEHHLQDEDLRCFRYLFSKADRNLLRRIELSEIPQEALPHFEYSLKHKKIFKDLLYVNLGRVNIPEVHVMVADFLLRLGQISSVIVSSIYKHNLIIIFRNDGYKEDAGKLASLAFGNFGFAGGHRYMARAEIPWDSMKKVLKRINKKAVDRFVLGRIKKFIRKTQTY